MQLNLNFPASLILLSFAALASASPIADDKGTLSKRGGCNGSVPLLGKKITRYRDDKQEADVDFDKGARGVTKYGCFSDCGFTFDACAHNSGSDTLEVCLTGCGNWA
ncbi:hypothetical protein B0H14DRAFT_3857902 [Mycena olivaceomarginata]|nr:hypothetical protein B0H14DRAFT_3857902 [Mycena olivaceomarginata]